MASNSAAASTACTTDDETTSSMDTDQDDHKEDNEEEHHHSKYGYDVETLSDREREELLMHLKHKLEHEETGVRDQDRIRDSFLELCLYSRHYDVDRAIQLLRNFMNFMEKHEWMDQLQPSHLEKTLQAGLHRLFPEGVTDNEGHEIITMELGHLDFDMYSVQQFQQTSLYSILKVMERPNAQRKGVAMVVDFHDLRMHTVRQVSSADFHRGKDLIYDTVPFKVRKIFLVRQGSISRTVMSMIKPFMSKRVKQRIVICDDHNPLTNYVQPEYVPIEWGGSSTNFAHQWESQVKTMVDSSSHPVLSTSSGETDR